MPAKRARTYKGPSLNEILAELTEAQMKGVSFHYRGAKKKISGCSTWGSTYFYMDSGGSFWIQDAAANYQYPVSRELFILYLERDLKHRRAKELARARTSVNRA